MGYREFLCVIAVLASVIQVMVSWNTAGTVEASDVPGCDGKDTT